MYEVSQAYLDKLYGIGKKRRVVSALLDDVAFDENDVIVSSLKFTWQCVGGAEINLGGVFLGQLWLTFSKNFADTITRGTWKGKQINLSIGLEIGEDPATHEPIFEYIPIGVYTIDEANHVAQGLEVTAYDNMRLFDKTLDFTTMSGSLYNFLDYACDKCGVELGMTREEIDALPNGTEVFSVYPDNDMETFRDLISWVSVTAGGFATISREGQLELRGWSSEPVQILGINDRYSGGSWSDFRTFYTGLSVTNIADQTTTYISNPPDVGLTMNIGANPLLQYGLIDTKTRQLHAILDALDNFDYVPFKVTAFADPFFDLGDVVQFNSGLAGASSKCCIMRLDFSFSKGVTLQGFGKNPALFGAQSKTDKDISGLNKQSQSNEFRFQVYTNPDEINLPRDPEYADVLSTQWSGREQIAELTFSANKETQVEVETVIRPLAKVQKQTIIYYLNQGKMKAVSRQLKLVFEIDGEEVETYKIDDYPATGMMPRFSQLDYAILDEVFEHYFALLHVEAGTRKTMRVYIEFSYGLLDWYTTAGGFCSVTILNGCLNFDPSDIKIYLKGQGLSVEAPWDGLIVCTDEIPLVAVVGLPSYELEDEVVVTLPTVIKKALEDEVEKTAVAGLSCPALSEALQITFTRPTCNIVTEDDLFNFTTEDGSFNLVTE